MEDMKNEFAQIDINLEKILAEEAKKLGDKNRWWDFKDPSTPQEIKREITLARLFAALARKMEAGSTGKN